MALDPPILYDLISSKISDKMIDNQDDNITTINGSQMQFSIIKINKATWFLPLIVVILSSWFQTEINSSNIHVTKSNQAQELQENPTKKGALLQMQLISMRRVQRWWLLMLQFYMI